MTLELQILVLSYETFRIHADRFDSEDSCDVLLCDEAHRLKNDGTLTNKAFLVLRTAVLVCARS